MAHPRIEAGGNPAVADLRKKMDRSMEFFFRNHAGILLAGEEKNWQIRFLRMPAFFAVGILEEPQQCLVSVQSKCKIAECTGIVFFYHFGIRADPGVDTPSFAKGFSKAEENNWLIRGLRAWSPLIWERRDTRERPGPAKGWPLGEPHKISLSSSFS